MPSKGDRKDQEMEGKRRHKARNTKLGCHQEDYECLPQLLHSAVTSSEHFRKDVALWISADFESRLFHFAAIGAGKNLSI
jgi:hypothetical protein